MRESLFNIVNLLFREFLEELNELLGKLLDSFPPQGLLAYKTHFVTALNNRHPSVKAVVLRQLIRCCKDNVTLGQIAGDQHLLESVLRLLGDEDLWSSKQSAAILKQVTREKEALSALLHPPVAHILNDVMDRGDVYRFRVFEVSTTRHGSKVVESRLESNRDTSHFVLKALDTEDTCFRKRQFVKMLQKW